VASSRPDAPTHDRGFTVVRIAQGLRPRHTKTYLPPGRQSSEERTTMKRIVITFGLISGGISALMMFAILPLVSRVSYESLTVLGYTVFVASFLMVFFGIRSYRDTVGGGAITFGKAFTVGILITLLSCAIYVISWDFHSAPVPSNLF
jgi:hypothetical protein